VHLRDVDRLPLRLRALRGADVPVVVGRQLLLARSGRERGERHAQVAAAWMGMATVRHHADEVGGVDQRHMMPVERRIDERVETFLDRARVARGDGGVRGAAPAPHVA